MIVIGYSISKKNDVNDKKVQKYGMNSLHSEFVVGRLVGSLFGYLFSKNILAFPLGCIKYPARHCFCTKMLFP